MSLNGENYVGKEEGNTSSDISDDEMVEPWENLLQHFTVNHLNLLKNHFDKKQQTSELIHEEISMNKEEFIQAIDNILGNLKYSLQATALFSEITNSDEGKISWSHFINYYLQQVKIDDEININFTINNIFPVKHINRESVAKIVLLETNSYFCFAIISKFGKVGLYEGNYNFLSQYSVIFMRNDPYFEDEIRRRKCIWVTDAIFLKNIRVLVVSNSCRSLTFYDASGIKHAPIYLVEGLPNSIQCITADNATLYMGDTNGNVFILTFLKAHEELLRKKYSDKLSSYYWRELNHETSHVTIKTIRNLHTNTINSIVLYPDISTIVTCSRDSKTSVSFYHLERKKQTFVFKISQGVRCFEICHNLHILITGNDTGFLQVWDIFITKQPIATCIGHKKAIVDVKIIKHKKLIMSCSMDAVLKLWNITDNTCLQTLVLNYPTIGILGKTVEWAVTSIYPGAKTLKEIEFDLRINKSDTTKTSVSECYKYDPWQRETILITCCNYIAEIKTNYENESDEDITLPPPPLQNDIKLPNDWKIERDINDVNTEENSSSVNQGKREIHDLLKINWFNENKLNYDINYRMTSLQKTKNEMKKCVSQCAPYCALNLYEIKEISLSEYLPVPDWKRTHKLVENTHRLLSAASTLSGIVSDRYSRSASSRSSIIEF